MKRLLLLAFAAPALALPAVPASASPCEDLPVNVACESSTGYCDVYKKPHPRLGRGICLRVTQ